MSASVRPLRQPVPGRVPSQAVAWVCAHSQLVWWLPTICTGGGTRRGAPVSAAAVLRGIVAANRAGERRGIPSVCSAHPLVIEACVDQAVADGALLLVEATCNQVNQQGGYTGMRPAGFAGFVAEPPGSCASSTPTM